MRCVTALVLCGFATIAQADPKIALPREAIEQIATARPKLIERVKPAQRGVDETLSALVIRGTAFVAKLTGLRRGLAGYVRVENIASTSHGYESAPRTVVIGIRIGERTDYLPRAMGMP